MMGNEVLVRYMYRQVYSQPSVHVYPYYTCDLVLTSTINSLKIQRRTDDARRKKVGSAIHSEYGYRSSITGVLDTETSSGTLSQLSVRINRQTVATSNFKLSGSKS